MIRVEKELSVPYTRRAIVVSYDRTDGVGWELD